MCQEPGVGTRSRIGFLFIYLVRHLCRACRRCVASCRRLDRKRGYSVRSYLIYLNKFLSQGTDGDADPLRSCVSL